MTRSLGARAGVIITDGTRLLLMHRIKNNANYYCILGGHLEDTESPKECAVRELKEETGIDVIVGNLFLELHNQGRMEYYFLADSWSGIPSLGGEEAQYNSPENQFMLEWIAYEKLSEIVLHPIEVHKKLIDLFQK